MDLFVDFARRLRNDGIILFIRSLLSPAETRIVVRRAIYGLQVHTSYNFQRVETREQREQLYFEEKRIERARSPVFDQMMDSF